MPGLRARGRTVTIAVAPVITRFTISRTRFTVGRDRTAVSAAAKPKRTGGTTIGVRVSELGRLRSTFDRLLPGRRVGKSCRKPSRQLRSRKACTRKVCAGALTRRLKRTTTSLRFSGRLGRKALPAGRCSVTATVTDAAGNVSAPKAKTVTVRR